MPFHSPSQPENSSDSYSSAVLSDGRVLICFSPHMPGRSLQPTMSVWWSKISGPEHSTLGRQGKNKWLPSEIDREPRKSYISPIRFRRIKCQDSTQRATALYSHSAAKGSDCQLLKRWPVA